MFPKRTPFRMQKLLDAAKGESCTMRIPGVCNHNPETVVAAHSNYSEDGKGAGQKADDFAVAFLCSACHDAYDGRAHGHIVYGMDLRGMFHLAMKRTWRRLLDRKILK